MAVPADRHTLDFMRPVLRPAEEGQLDALQERAPRRRRRRQTGDVQILGPDRCHANTSCHNDLDLAWRTRERAIVSRIRRAE